MIMNGMQSTHIPHRGRMKNRMCAVVVLIISIVLCACSGGRGDYYIRLINGYSIDVVNSSQIFLIHSSPNEVGNRIVLENYFVVSYQICESYILLEGIKTQDIHISNEELNNRVLSYYLINTDDDDVIGPFESYNALEEQCLSIGLEMENKWTDIQ